MLRKTKEDFLSTRSVKSPVHSVSLFVPYLLCATSWDKCAGHSKVVSFPKKRPRRVIKILTSLIKYRNMVENFL